MGQIEEHRIKFTDRLPEEGQMILVSHSHSVSYAATFLTNFYYENFAENVFWEPLFSKAELIEAQRRAFEYPLSFEDLGDHVDRLFKKFLKQDKV